MKFAPLMLMLVISASAWAGDPFVADSAASAPEMSPAPSRPSVLDLVKKQKKKVSGIVKNASYILSWYDEEGQYQEAEVIATGRYTQDACEGTLYEVYNDDFNYFAKLKDLKRIYGSR